MKLNLRKIAIPVIIAGVIFYGGSKIGKIKNNEDYNNTINQVTVQTENTIDENLPDDETVIDMDNIKETETKKEEEPVDEHIKVRQIDGTEIETRKVVKATSAVNVRSTAAEDGIKLSVLESGQSLDYINQENDKWYKVKYNDQEAYISSDYSTVTEETRINAELQKMVYFKNGSKLYQNLNGTDSLENIPELEAAPVYGESNGYYLTTINNKVGYINKKDTQDLKDTFVIVDISDQTAYLYEDNKLIVSTPVVTGKDSTPTTKGLHEVWLIENNRFLKGEGYNVYVDYFMAFNGGEGLHDAEYHTHYNSDGSIAFSHGWRSKTAFGAELYKNGGSHGCVNMPYEAATAMSQHLQLGDKVLVKQ